MTQYLSYQASIFFTSCRC